MQKISTLLLHNFHLQPIVITRTLNVCTTNKLIMSSFIEVLHKPGIINGRK